MPSLSIPFPEKDTPATLVLTGRRITVGRRPDNTIQVLDRTLSAAHAELVAEADGHYRLHDLGSTNGTRVNGEMIEDYHLKEPCTISFGTLDCAFAPEVAAEAGAAEMEALPTRSEMEALRQVNVELRGNIELLREQLAALKKLPSGEPEAGSVAALSDQLQRLIVERGAGQEAEQQRMREMERLKADLALAKRDRINLENALRHANAENERLKTAAPVAGANGSEAPPRPQVPAPPAQTQTEPPAKAVPAPPPAPAPAPLKAYPPPSRPSFPTPSAPSLSPASSPARGAAPGQPIPKFNPTARPAVSAH